MRSAVLFILLAAAGVSAFVASVACTAILDTSVEQCVADGDCAARGFATTRCVEHVCVASNLTTDAAADAPVDAPPVDPIRGCLGNVKWEPEDPTIKINLRGRYVRFLGEAPVADMAIKACGRLDPSCAVSLGSATTDADGYYNLKVSKGFAGFLALTPPANFTEMVPALVYPIPPPTIDQPLDTKIGNDLSAHVTTVGELNFLLDQIGSAVDPGLGHIFGLALDCQGKPAADVSLRVSVRDKKTITYYTTEATGLPSPDGQATTARGEAGFMNLPAGPVTVEATTSPGRTWGQYTVLVKPGHIIYLPMPPSPSP